LLRVFLDNDLDITIFQYPFNMSDYDFNFNNKPILFPGTVAGQQNNPFLEGWTPPRESTTLSRPGGQSRGVTKYGGIGMNRGATLPPPSRGALTLPPKPSVLNFSKKAQVCAIAIIIPSSKRKKKSLLIIEVFIMR
jgi:hypothetical protein